MLAFCQFDLYTFIYIYRENRGVSDGRDSLAENLFVCAAYGNEDESRYKRCSVCAKRNFIRRSRHHWARAHFICGKAATSFVCAAGGNADESRRKRSCAAGGNEDESRRKGCSVCAKRNFIRHSRHHWARAHFICGKAATSFVCAAGGNADESRLKRCCALRHK